jgi:hypothetical protein
MSSNLQVKKGDLKVRYRGFSIQHFRSNLQVIYEAKSEQSARSMRSEGERLGKPLHI